MIKLPTRYDSTTRIMSRLNQEQLRDLFTLGDYYLYREDDKFYLQCEVAPFRRFCIGYVDDHTINLVEEYDIEAIDLIIISLKTFNYCLINFISH